MPSHFPQLPRVLFVVGDVTVKFGLLEFDVGFGEVWAISRFL